MFSLTQSLLDRNYLAEQLAATAAGAYVCFEGWVRDHNAGKSVLGLEYQVYGELALKEGNKILAEAKLKFDIIEARCIHRYGHLEIKDLAIWIGVTAAHRSEAYAASRYIIDEIKHRLPIWKKEHYVNDQSRWVFCRDHHHHVSFTKSDYFQRQKPLLDAQSLENKHVVIVGIGGLGCPALVNLASAGVGHFTLIDFDKVAISNLHRQFLYNPDQIGKFKVEMASNFIKKLNPYCSIDILTLKAEDVDFELISSTKKIDLILDCTDNLSAKFFLHDYCFKTKTALISASVYKLQGEIRSFLMRENTQSGCWRCTLNYAPFDLEAKTCSETGSIATVTNYVASVQSNEVVLYLNTGENNSNSHTILLDLNNLNQMKIKNHAKPTCTICNAKETHIPKHNYAIKKSELNQEMIVLNTNDVEIAALKSRLDNKEKIVLDCQKKIKSKSLAQYFRSLGYKSIYYLESHE
jgi:molybdopterin/thiamine biosynthesis adenylyltransferase/molybdopterin synthase catalytic subunit